MKKTILANITDFKILNNEQKKTVLGGIFDLSQCGDLRVCFCDVYGEHTNWQAATCARSIGDAEQIIRSRSKRIIDSIRCDCELDETV